MRGERKKIFAVLALASVGLCAVACGSSNTTGTETITGMVTGTAAVAGAPTIPLRLTGPVSTTASITLGTGTTKNRLVTFKTPDGNFVVRHTKTKVGHELMITCEVKYLTTATYSVLGSQGTGKFTGAKGNGKLSITFQGNLPKLSKGQCESTKIRPAEKGAVIMFHASGPLTVGK